MADRERWHGWCECGHPYLHHHESIRNRGTEPCALCLCATYDPEHLGEKLAIWTHRQLTARNLEGNDG